MVHGGARGAAAVLDPVEEPQAGDADGGGQVDLGRRVHGERDEPVDVGRGEAGVVQRGQGRLGGQPQLAAPGVLGELGGPDPGDGHLPGHPASPGDRRGPASGGTPRPEAYCVSARTRLPRGRGGVLPSFPTPAEGRSEHSGAGGVGRFGDGEGHGGGDVGAQGVGGRHRDGARVAVAGRDLAGDVEGVARVGGGAQADGQRVDAGGGARPVRHVTLHQAHGREDVEEDVRGALRAGHLGIVVDRGEVAGGQRRRHDQAARQRNRQVGQPVARAGRAGLGRAGTAGAPLRQHQVVVHALEGDHDRHADVHVARRDVQDVADHADALGQRHHRHDERDVSSWHRRVVVHDEARHLTAPRRHHVVPLHGPALRAHRPGRMPERAAPGAPLHPQLARGRPLPEERGVPVDRGPQRIRRRCPARGHHGARVPSPGVRGRGGGGRRPSRISRGRARRVPRGGGVRGRGGAVGAELEDAEEHAGHALFAHVPGGVPGDEVALAHRRALGAGHLAHADRGAHALAHAEVAVVGVLAVRGHHAGEPRRVQQRQDLGGGVPARVVGILRGPGGEAGHRPDLGHRRRGHQAGVAGRDGRALGQVDGVGVADGLDPVPHHRHVHRVRRLRPRPLPIRHQPRRQRHDPLSHVHHRGARGRPRPSVAIGAGPGGRASPEPPAHGAFVWLGRTLSRLPTDTIAPITAAPAAGPGPAWR